MSLDNDGSGRVSNFSWFRRSALLLLLIPVCCVVFGYYSMPCFVLSEDTAYDRTVLQDHPVGYYPLSDERAACDHSGNKFDGTFSQELKPTYIGTETVKVFNGLDQYATIPARPEFSVPKTGVLTLEAWIRSDVLTFPHSESSGYVNVIGKGMRLEQEYTFRLYSQTNSENRPNRFSGYVFNQQGGRGVGSYFQDVLMPGEWIHVVLVINTRSTETAFSVGYTKIFRDGVLRDQDSLKSDSQNIQPATTNQPLNLGTRDYASYFKGSIGKVAVYDYELSPEQIQMHYEAIKIKK